MAEIDRSLEAMVWRVVARFGELTGAPLPVPRAVAYAAIDGLFQPCLLKHLPGDAQAVPAMKEQVRWTISRWLA